MICDENSYLTKAMHAYENRQAIAFDEFKEDLNRVNTIKKCIARYQNGDAPNIRLILNNFVILYNVFGTTTFDLIKYKLDKEHFPVAFAFLVKLNRLPVAEMIMLDQVIVDQLRTI